MSAAPAPTRQDIDRLIALGRRKGVLTPADLHATLPIRAMSAEDIAQVVLEVEEAGVPVELEELLGGLAHPGGVAPLPIAPSPGLPASGGPPEPEGAPSDADRGANATQAAEPPPEALRPGDRRRVSLSVLVAGIAVLLVCLALLLVLGR